MSGTISVPDLCRKNDFQPPSISYRKDQLLNSAPEIFKNHGRKVGANHISLEKDKAIARLKVTIIEIV